MFKSLMSLELKRAEGHCFFTGVAILVNDVQYKKNS